MPIPEVVARALDMGINYFDTSRDYADSEKTFSGVIKGRQRDKIVIATKSPNRKKDAIIKDLDTSLKELGVDYVDIWHLHARDTPAAIPDEAIEAMEICKKSGKARFIGFSCHDPNNMVDFIIKTGKFDVMQTTYSYPIGGIYRDQAIKKLHDAGIGVIAMKVVVALTGLNIKTFDNQPPTKGEGPLAGIKWVLQNPAIGTTVPHMKTIPELEMNFRAMSEPYTPKDEKLLYVMNEQIRPDYCRMCYECKGQCPKGVPVTDVLRFLAYNDFCGNYHQAVANFRGLAQGSARCALQRLFLMCHPVPQRSPRSGSADPRAAAAGIAHLFFEPWRPRKGSKARSFRQKSRVKFSISPIVYYQQASESTERCASGSNEET